MPDTFGEIIDHSCLTRSPRVKRRIVRGFNATRANGRKKQVPHKIVLIC